MDKGRYQAFREALARRVLVLDGSLGVQIGRLLATGGRNVDSLNITDPGIVARVHRDYLAAGADIIETNTFNSNRLSQSVYALQDRVRELNIRGAEIARRQADAFQQREPDRIRFVAGSMGPTAASASLPNDVD
ncbi:MAG: homocysteine S-methyltransferase family protein, partial [Bacteroidaceae bacterium]|nr:homocysteine S-methyltransferase family protein [Bacteroidaceae bacterium]